MQRSADHINFKIERDFSLVFGDGFRFLRQNFTKFLKCMIFITGPFLLVMSVSYGLMYGNIISSTLSASYTSGPSSFFGLEVTIELVLFILSAILMSVFWMGTLIHFMSLYSEKGKGNFTVEDVWKAVLRDFWRLLGTSFGLFLIYLIVVVIIALIFVAAVSIPVLGVLFGIGLFFGILIIGPPLFHWIYSVYIVRCVERKDFFSSIARATKLMRGNFWWTWLISFINMMMGYIAMYIFMIPLYIAMAVFAFHDISNSGTPGDISLSFTIILTLVMFLGTLVWNVPYLVLAMHHYSLVEKKDGTGMMEMIDEIGKAEENPNLNY